MKKKRIVCMSCLTLILVLAGCNKQSGEDINGASGNVVTLADEIASGVSEDIIPEEAKAYTELTFELPIDMSADPENTETEQIYLSDIIGDCSFIALSRQPSDEKVDYGLITEDDYKEAFENQVGSTAVIQSFEKEYKDEYLRIKISLIYGNGVVSYSADEFIFITDRYIYNLIYSLDTQAKREDSFEKSEETITLKSLIKTVSDNDIEGVPYNDYGIVTMGDDAIDYHDVVDDISAGAEKAMTNKLSLD